MPHPTGAHPASAQHAPHHRLPHVATSARLRCNGHDPRVCAAMTLFYPPMESVPRNAPCPCGSGKKYKHCHLDKPVEVKSPRVIVPLIFAIVGVLVAVYLTMNNGLALGLSIGAGWLIVVGLFALLRDPPPPGKGGDPGAINFGG